MTDTARLRRCVEDAQRNLERAAADLHEHRARRRIHCLSCDKHHSIKELELLVIHRYVEPHGCTDGDYWTPCEWRFACPVDGSHNRIMFHDWDVPYENRGKAGIAARPTFEQFYRDCFRARRDVKERHPLAGHNNDYVDQHRERFELPLRPVRPAAARLAR